MRDSLEEASWVGLLDEVLTESESDLADGPLPEMEQQNSDNLVDWDAVFRLAPGQGLEAGQMKSGVFDGIKYERLLHFVAILVEGFEWVLPQLERRCPATRCGPATAFLYQFFDELIHVWHRPYQQWVQGNARPWLQALPRAVKLYAAYEKPIVARVSLYLLSNLARWCNHRRDLLVLMGQNCRLCNDIHIEHANSLISRGVATHSELTYNGVRKEAVMWKATQGLRAATSSQPHNTTSISENMKIEQHTTSEKFHSTVGKTGEFLLKLFQSASRCRAEADEMHTSSREQRGHQTLINDTIPTYRSYVDKKVKENTAAVKKRSQMEADEASPQLRWITQFSTAQLTGLHQQIFPGVNPPRAKQSLVACMISFPLSDLQKYMPETLRTCEPEWTDLHSLFEAGMHSETQHLFDLAGEAIVP